MKNKILKTIKKAIKSYTNYRKNYIKQLQKNIKKALLRPHEGSITALRGPDKAYDGPHKCMFKKPLKSALTCARLRAVKCI